MPLTSPLNSFLSSTCYDLVDLRRELASWLAVNGCIMRLSEDPNSAFYVDPMDDSIESCLTNVEASDVIVCIIDRRYGGVLGNGPHAGISATHAEIRHARDLGKPIFFFIRDVSFQEYGFMRQNRWEFKTAWVEPDIGGNANPRRELWFRFVEEIARMPKHANWSNWCDTFQSVVDLKPLVLKRLMDKFPAQANVLALKPDRAVRLAFTQLGNHQNGAIRGYFRNIGTGPAINLRHGFVRDQQFSYQHDDAGIASGDRLCATDLGTTYATDNGQGNHNRALFCTYENAYGDVYRIEVPVIWQGGLPHAKGRSRFFAGPPGTSNENLLAAS